MSRTYRKRDSWFGTSKENHIKCNLRWRCLRYYTVEALIKEAENEWEEAARDSRAHWRDSGRNGYFKHIAKRAERRSFKVLERKIMKGEMCENIIYPHRKIGKALTWRVW